MPSSSKKKKKAKKPQQLQTNPYSVLLSPVAETIDEASIGSDPLPASMALAPPTMCTPSASASTEDAAFAALDAALHAPPTYVTVAASQLLPLPPLPPPVVSASTPFLSMIFGSPVTLPPPSVSPTPLPPLVDSDDPAFLVLCICHHMAPCPALDACCCVTIPVSDLLCLATSVDLTGFYPNWKAHIILNQVCDTL